VLTQSVTAKTGGWADHVVAPLAPAGTTAEYLNDPFTPSLGSQPTGPGFRLPFYVVSPWTRNGGVFTETASHESQSLFLEQWSTAIGKGFTNPNISPWRRAHMTNLLKMFDFSRKDASIPNLPSTRAPSQDASTGQYNGAATCQAKYGGDEPSIPYTNQSDAVNLATEKGFKQTRGTLTEGRFLTFEANGKALGYNATSLTLNPSASTHCQSNQRFTLQATSSIPNQGQFLLKAATLSTPAFVDSNLQLTHDASKADVFTITDLGNGQGYQLVESGGQKRFLEFASSGQPALGKSGATKMSIFSVSC
jgi:phospholipase C